METSQKQPVFNVNQSDFFKAHVSCLLRTFHEKDNKLLFSISRGKKTIIIFQEIENYCDVNRSYFYKAYFLLPIHVVCFPLKIPLDSCVDIVKKCIR